MNLIEALRLSQKYLDKEYRSGESKLLPKGMETTNFWWINYDAPDNRGEFAGHIILNKSTKEIVITTCPPSDIVYGHRFITEEEFNNAREQNDVN
ncbi:MAG: hypothetical protein IJW23_08780 [Lentisphaeria bacterium]|nr:hypothetical protein [Lentisphaeria bacterium]